jgi:hypothetical protein
MRALPNESPLRGQTEDWKTKDARRALALGGRPGRELEVGGRSWQAGLGTPGPLRGQTEDWKTKDARRALALGGRPGRGWTSGVARGKPDESGLPYNPGWAEVGADGKAAGRLGGVADCQSAVQQTASLRYRAASLDAFSGAGAQVWRLVSGSLLSPAQRAQAEAWTPYSFGSNALTHCPLTY